jgi:flagellar biosynthetic protein FliO
MRSIQSSFQNWLKADRKRITWVLILMVISVGVLGLIFAWANSSLPAASAAMADGTPDRLSSPFYFLGVFVKLVGVLLLMFGAAYFVKRWKGNPSSVQAHKSQMFIVESLRLSPRQALHLVKAGDQVFLVGATDQSLTLVSEVESMDGVEIETQPVSSEKMMDFGKIFSNKMKQTDSKDAAPVLASTPEN